MKKILMIIIALSLSAITFYSCTRSQVGNVPCKCYVFQNSSFDNCYLIEVKENQIIKTEVGFEDYTLRSSLLYKNKKIPYDKLRLRKVIKSKSYKLGKRSFAEIQKKIREISDVKEQNEYVESGWNDGWGVILLVNGKQYAFCYSDNNKSGLMPLVDLLKKKSPIKLFERKYEYMDVRPIK